MREPRDGSREQSTGESTGSAGHVHGLVAAYALHALDEVETAAVEQHIAACADCREDLREFRETLARLGSAHTVEPDEALWHRIRARVEQAPQLGPATSGERSRVLPLRRRWPVRALAVAATLFLVVAVGLSVQLVSAHRELSALRAESDRVHALLAATDVERTTGTIGPGSMSVVVYTSRVMDTAVLMVDGLQPPPDGMGYQVWFVEPDDTMRSAGMLETMDGDTMSIVCTGLGDTAQLGITMEPMQGAKQPSKPPMKIDV